MPNVAACVTLELYNNARQHVRMCADGVFPALLVRLGSFALAGETEPAIAIEPELIELLAVENLKLHQMQVDRMRILGGVEQFPDFDSAKSGIFGYRVVPVKPVEKHSPSSRRSSLLFSMSGSRRLAFFLTAA